jgi:hypothetical protein
MGHIFVFGVLRSGMSWLAKIFDSHPDVVYRHESDLDFRNTSIPFCPEENVPYLEETREYIAQLMWLNAVKFGASSPHFFPNDI